MIKVSRILKSDCNKRAWISPEGQAVVFPANQEHSSYAPRILKDFGMKDLITFQFGKMDGYAAKDILEKKGWLTVGRWGDYITSIHGNSCTDTQIHDIQKLISDPSWKTKCVNFEVKFFVDLTYDEFMTIDKFIDLRRMRNLTQTGN